MDVNKFQANNAVLRHHVLIVISRYVHPRSMHSIMLIRASAASENPLSSLVAAEQILVHPIPCFQYVHFMCGVSSIVARSTSDPVFSPTTPVLRMQHHIKHPKNRAMTAESLAQCRCFLLP